MTWATLAVAAALAAVHLFGRRLTFLDVLPRSRYLSIAGGVAVAYAIVHLLPELAEIHRHVAELVGDRAWARDHAGYLIALAGLTVFYGLERLVESRSRPVHRPRPGTPASPTGHDAERPHDAAGAPGAGVFWLHIGNFALYNALFGGLLTRREDATNRSLVLFGVAIGLHFLVNDHALRHQHPVRYRRTGRWVLAAAILLGWAAGRFLPIPTVAVSAAVGFLVGGVLLNTFKEELPDERESRYWAFVGGAAAYTAVLVLA